jgi:hypothetical protein
MSRLALLSLLCASAIGAVASGGDPLVSGEPVWTRGADAAASTSSMHVCMEFPLSRVGQDCTARSPQKVGPCGVEERSANVNVFRPGETITMVFNETVNHPSHYRVSFNPSGDDFPDPVNAS